MEEYEDIKFTKGQQEKAEQLYKILNLKPDYRTKEKIIETILAVMYMK